MRRGKRLAGTRINEPQPRRSTGGWSPFEPAVMAVHDFARPTVKPTASFAEVLETRRSGLGGPVAWPRIADLLWFAAGVRGYHPVGRAGIPIQWSATPSAGGLGCVRVVCLADDGSRPRLYDPFEHRLLELDIEAEFVAAANRETVKAVVGKAAGCTLRLIADEVKLSAAYSDAESLMFRDAGALVATLALCAVWLGMTACPLGFLGDDLVPKLGFPADRFRGVGAVQIGRVVHGIGHPTD